MKFIAGADDLTIKLEGMEQVFALKRRLVLPKKDIADIQWTAEFADKDRTLRIGGAGVPGTLLAGRFRDLNTGEKLFLYVNKPKGINILSGFSAQNVLIVTMLDGRYSQIIMTCQADIGARLTAWWRAGE